MHLEWFSTQTSLRAYSTQASAFKQPTPANIHQYQFNNPIVLYDTCTLQTLSFSVFNDDFDYKHLINLL